MLNANTDDVKLLEIQQRALERYSNAKKLQDFKQSVDFQLSQADRDYIADAQQSGTRSKTRFFPVHGIPQGFAAARSRQARDEQRPQRSEDAAQSSSAAGALLTPAKSRSRFIEVKDKETGEIQRFTRDESRSEYVQEFDPVAARLESFALQAAAREILKGETKKSDKGREVARYRVCNCLRAGLSGSDAVSILRSRRHDSVRFGGLQTCGSVWHCKVCATRVSEVRKLEIRSAVDSWLAGGHGVLFLTNTFPHSREDDLRILLDRFLGVAWHRYCNHRAYKRCRKSLGYLGRIRAVEVTHSEANGWHPHIHEIWFVEKPLKNSELKELNSILFECWRASAVGAGFSAPSRKHGFSVQGAESAADYIAKFGTEPRWEVAKELAKSHTKKSRDRKGRTPFDLLRSFAESGCKRSAQLFREYALAFAGQVQLYWSQGLKAAFGIQERHDEEIASVQDDDAELIARITWEDWRLILRSRYRGHVLEVVRNGGAVGLEVFLKGLRSFYGVPVQAQPFVSAVGVCGAFVAGCGDDNHGVDF